MPSRIVFALDRSQPHISDAKTGSESKRAPTQHAAKSEVLRSVLRLDKDILKRKSSRPDAPAGLGNWDNSCYQNSILQALASIPSLEAFLANKAVQSLDFPLDSTAFSLYEILKKLNSQSNAGSYLWTPSKLKSMSSWQQQDAQEYFSKVIEEVEKDVTTAEKSSSTAKSQANLFESSSIPSAQLEALGTETEAEQAKRNEVGDETTKGMLEDNTSRSNRVLQNPLEGLLAQRVGCMRCGYTEGLSLIPFNCLTLPLGRGWQFDIQDCLNEYTCLEPIDGVECAKCTLLQSKIQLRKLSETLATTEEEDRLDQNRESVRAKLDQKQAVTTQLEAVTEAIEEADFSEATLTKKCEIPSRLRVLSTKSRQAIIMRPPKTLVLHLNRSLFDENTGAQLKNFADVRYPAILDIAPWSIGNKFRIDLADASSITEEWEMNPTRSMIQSNDCFDRISTLQYGLRAVITHYGRHENGHYICYRKLLQSILENEDQDKAENGEKEKGQHLHDAESWWRLSDEDVSQIPEDEVLGQGGVFMLFYEQLNPYFIQQTEVLAKLTAQSKDTQDFFRDLRISAKPNDSKEVSEEDHTERSPQMQHHILEDTNASVNTEDIFTCHQGDSRVETSDAPLTEANEMKAARTTASEESSAEQESMTSFESPPRQRCLGVPAMKTAGPEMHQSDDRSSFRPLHMVASM